MLILKIILLSKYLAIKRRFCLYFFKIYNPYPKIPNGINFSPSIFHEHYTKSIVSKISFENSKYSKEIFQNKTRSTIKELIGFEDNLEFRILSSQEYIFKKIYIRKRFIVRLDTNREIPIETLRKISEKKIKGIMVCMQGTNSGSHLNFGEIKIGKVLIDKPYSFALVKLFDPDFKEFKDKELDCGKIKAKIINSY